MANWNSLILTNLGKELNAKINAGLTTLRFNRVALGSGTPTSSTITALSKEEQSFPFDVNPPKVKGRVMTLEFTAHNKDLVKQYTIRELGLFAQDPERGSILFAYMTDNAPDIMPARGTATVVTRKMNLNITTDNTGSVSVTTTGKFITIEDLNAHNTSSSAHADIRQLFKNYLPLTGGTVTGRLYVNDAVFMGTETSQYGNFIETSKAGTMYLASGKSENSNLSWFNVDGYFKYPNTAEMCVIKRDENANILARAYLLDQNNKTRFPGEVYSNEKLLATKEYVDGKKWGSTSITDGAVTPTKLDRPYLPLTGGTVSGRTHIDSMLSVGQSSAEASNIRVDGAAGNAYIALSNYNNAGSLLIDGYFNNPETANIDVTNRNAEGTVRYRSTLMDGDGNAKFANDVYANNKLLATKEYVDGKKWRSTSITDGAITPTKLDRAYLPLTGGTITGRLHVNDLVSTGSDTMQFSNFIQTSLAGKAYLTTGKNNSDNWFNVDGYFNNPEQSNIGVLKRNANGDVIARAYLLHNDNKTYFPNEVYANNKLLATKEYVDAKGTNDLNAHNTSGGAHADIRRMFNNYLPLTGGTLTGNLNFTSTKGIMHPIGVGGGGTGANLNLGSAKTTSSTALCCINRPMWWDDNSARNLALEEDVNAHDSSSSAHNDIRQLFKWKKLYSINRAAFTMPASGTALCDIPSTWKELYITWVWRGDKSTINTVVGYEAYTINIVNEVTGDPIIFVAPGSEGYMTVKNNKLYVIHRGDSNDGAPVLVMWR